MKPIYKSLMLAAMTLQVSVALRAQINDGESIVEKDVQVESLEGLKVQLIEPNVSGVRDLVEGEDYEVAGKNITITLNAGNWLKGGVYRLQVVATFGTQTQVIYALDVTVPRYETLASEPQEYEETVTVVSTFGDGDKSGADATVYAKDGDGNAHITKPLVVSGGVQEGDSTTASGESSHAEGNNTTASGDYSHAEGSSTTASGTPSHAEGNNTTASGDYSHAEGDSTIASGNCSHAEGNSTTASGENSHAEGSDTTASGDYSHAEGNGTVAAQDNQHVCGKYNVVDEDDSFALIVGNGTDDEHRKNAFAVTKSGELALFEADGTPVILDAATLKALIASLQ